MNTKTYVVGGMSCAACVNSIEKTLNKFDTIDSVKVNLLKGEMQVSGLATDESIIEAVEGLGFTIWPKGEVASTKNQEETGLTGEKQKLVISFVFLFILMYFSMGKMLYLPLPHFLLEERYALSSALIQFFLTLPILFIYQHYYKKGLLALFQRRPNMDSLVALGSGASFVYGIAVLFILSHALATNNTSLLHHYHDRLYFESTGMILCLISLGKYFEARAKAKTNTALMTLAKLMPDKVSVKREEGFVTIASKDLKVGDEIEIRPGERVPVDGIITFGQTSLDESAMTGESLPIHKTIGDRVTSATLNKSGYFIFRATEVGEDTSLAQIIRLVDEANQTKAPIARLADKIAGIFVPFVLSLSILAFIIWILLGKDFAFALSIAISVLLISCPCALGLATPVAIMVGTGVGAKEGLLFKSGEALEKMSEVDAIFFDKTGTITKGEPTLTSIIPLSSLEKSDLLTLAYSLELKSEHPLALAIIASAKQEGLSPLEITHFTSLTGKGIVGKIGEKTYTLGAISLLEKVDASLKHHLDKLTTTGHTPIILLEEGLPLALFGLKDAPKPEAKATLENLKMAGKKLYLLTGDKKETAEAIGKAFPFDEIIAEALPEKKTSAIKAKQKDHVVAMVGDGINDAPALATSDIGIAIGKGTDIAIASGDVILMRDDLTSLVNAFTLSKKTLRNIKENLFWAFSYNIIAIPLACGVFSPWGITLNPMFASALMSLSSLLVVTNALRLRGIKFKIGKEEDITPIQTKGERNMIETTVEVFGMSCPHCSSTVKKVLETLPSVEHVEVSLEDKKATILSRETLAQDKISQLITEKDFTIGQITEVTK